VSRPGGWVPNLWHVYPHNQEPALPDRVCEKDQDRGPKDQQPTSVRVDRETKPTNSNKRNCDCVE